MKMFFCAGLILVGNLSMAMANNGRTCRLQNGEVVMQSGKLVELSIENQIYIEDLIQDTCDEGIFVTEISDLGKASKATVFCGRDSGPNGYAQIEVSCQSE